MEAQPTKTDFGYEVIWASTNSYEARFLVFENVNSKTDIFLDKEIDKTWFVNAGKFKIRWIDTTTGQILEQEFSEGTTFHVEAMKPTQIICLQTNSSITEVSNVRANDRYTIMDSKLVG
jgi:hypothetical protein